MLRLYDTATREVRELALREPGKVGIYLCGPTVYGPPHIGHGRATLVYDILRRYLESTGLEVRLVSNVTDIDDKIIERAQREQRPWTDITRKCERMWFEAMGGINVKRPTDIPHATEYVERMVEMIGELVDGGNAYATEDGIYLSVETVDGYGLLAQQSLDDMRSGGGERDVFGADFKRHPADFVLWKFSKPGEPAWPSPWGEGRPGWHSECVVMSLDLLGEGFDLHCGGQDLRFPHHENERAQAVALGRQFANHWMHNGFVVDAEGEKMSKSLGNVSNLLDLIDQYDPRAYRMVLLQSHYRSPITITADTIDAATKSLAGLDSFVARSGKRRRRPDGARRGGARRVHGGDGRRPRHAARDGAVVRHGSPRQRRARRRRRVRARAGCGRAPDRRHVRLGARHRRRGPRRRARAGGRARCRPRPPRTSPTADAIRAALQADGWTVETGKSGTTVRR